MLSGDTGVILLVLVYFIIVVIVLTLLWRISIALDLIAQHLFVIAKDVKKLSIHFRESADSEKEPQDEPKKE